MAAGKWDGAYYLSGYAVELALKACIIKLLLSRDVFPEKDFSKGCYSHNIRGLLKVADLEAVFLAAAATDPALAAHWAVAAGWSEQKRYHRTSEAEARELYNAITDLSHGVLQWIKNYW